MIESADEFYRLRTSKNPAEYERAVHDGAPEEVWRAVLARYPEMRFWVAQNKTVPVHVLDTLADDPDWPVRHMVARKRKMPESVQRRLARDAYDGGRRALVRHAVPCAA
jgi:hypothetical protein